MYISVLKYKHILLYKIRENGIDYIVSRSYYVNIKKMVVKFMRY